MKKELSLPGFPVALQRHRPFHKRLDRGYACRLANRHSRLPPKTERCRDLNHCWPCGRKGGKAHRATGGSWDLAPPTRGEVTPPPTPPTTAHFGTVLAPRAGGSALRVAFLVILRFFMVLHATQASTQRTKNEARQKKQKNNKTRGYSLCTRPHHSIHHAMYASPSKHMSNHGRLLGTGISASCRLLRPRWKDERAEMFCGNESSRKSFRLRSDRASRRHQRRILAHCTCRIRSHFQHHWVRRAPVRIPRHKCRFWLL